MKKRHLILAFLTFTIFLVGLSAIFLGGIIPKYQPTPTPSPTSTITPTQTPSPTPNASPINSPTPTPINSNSDVPTYTYQIVNTYPHDDNAFTQGLVFDNGSFYESTGGLGNSYLRHVDLTSGNILKEYKLPDEFFGEGLALVNDRLIQLTWLSNMGFIYDKKTFNLLGNFTYSTEGWGLTYDGAQLIMSDGTSTLYFLDPNTLKTTAQVSVKDGDTSIININELEYVNGDVYANIWLQQKIAIINPQTGQVKGWIDLTGIYRSNDPNAVLNGIAYNAQNDQLYITGKYWPNLYQIKITQTQ